MTSPGKLPSSRSTADLDKTLIKAKPVTAQNRVLGASPARRARGDRRRRRRSAARGQHIVAAVRRTACICATLA
jgi:hypothetical protein